MPRRQDILVGRRSGTDIVLDADTGLEKRLTSKQLKTWRESDRQALIDYLEKNPKVRKHRFRKNQPKGAERVLEGTVVDTYLLKQTGYTNYQYILYLVPKEGIWKGRRLRFSQLSSFLFSIFFPKRLIFLVVVFSNSSSLIIKLLICL